MRRHLLKQDVLHADETTLQVLKEPGKAAQSDDRGAACRTRGTKPPGAGCLLCLAVPAEIPD
ncbi:IS66 family transposase, partial [Paenibacillus popilliae]|uniref:IS66 family transposase n=1 Tax=Paenibacillus popilliae TaxID=78057 RepID=UPI003BF5423B